jgi:hypothetical protein
MQKKTDAIHKNEKIVAAVAVKLPSLGLSTIEDYENRFAGKKLHYVW